MSSTHEHMRDGCHNGFHRLCATMETVFTPETSPLFRNLNFDLNEPPPYLFRTFDPKSSGYTDENITMSPAAVRKLPHHDRDIFSLESDFAMEVLEKHQNPWRRKNKPPEPEPNIDNFTSWATSLLYVVQYAYHRRRLYGCSEDEIKIIAVDTSLFPPRTFIRSSAILEAYFRLVKRDDMRNTIGTRLCGYTYTFGVFICQGTLVHHRHCDKANGPTSHIISLADLRQNGLPTLYPELEDASGHAKWALTTIALRKIWHGDECGEVDRWKTTFEELQAATNLAVRWFKPPFDPLKVAIYFLSFKRREHDFDGTGIMSTKESWARHPVDVREFALVVQAVDQANQDDRVDSPLEIYSRDCFGDALGSGDHSVDRLTQTLLHSYIS